MTLRASPLHAAWQAVRRTWLLYHLGAPEFRFLFDPAPPDEWVALDCETTGLNVRSDEIIAIGAVRIVGNRILSSERLELLVRPQRAVSAQSIRIHRLRQSDVDQGLELDDALKRLLHFIGSRPLVGYYLEFDLAMLNRALFPLLGQGLPQPCIEVSGLYYDYKLRYLSEQERLHPMPVDLRFASMMQDLDLPMREAHDALNDAVMAALAFIKLRSLAQA